MSTFPIRHCYATPALLKSYLNSSLAQGWTQDDGSLLTMLEGCSRRIDAYLGNQSVGPRYETHHYDLGWGGLRNDNLVYTRLRYLPSWDRPLLETATVIGGTVALGDWLLGDVADPTVTVYTDSNESTAFTYLRARPGDPAYRANPTNYAYWLDPEDEQQKRWLKLNELAPSFLYGGQRTLQITGLWGWQYAPLPLTTLSAAITDVAATTFTVVAANALQAGMTLLIDTEQLYVRSTAPFGVLRGVNGTTAATHLNTAPVSSFEYPGEVVEACLDLGRVRWRGRQAGQGQGIAMPEMGILQLPRPGAEEESIVRRLDSPFRAKAFSRGSF